MHIKKIYTLLLCFAMATIINCGSSSVNARNVTHPVMVGPVSAVKSKDRVEVVGAYEVTVTNETFVSAGGSTSKEESAGKVDANLLKSIKSPRDMVAVKEVRYKNYYLGFIPLIAGSSNDATVNYDFKTGAEDANAVKGKKK